MPKLRHASANDYKPGKNFDFVVNIAKKFLGQKDDQKTERHAREEGAQSQIGF